MHLQPIDGIEIARHRITVMQQLRRRQIPKRERQQEQDTNRHTYSSKMRGSLAERLAPSANRLYLGLHGDSLYGSDRSVLLAWEVGLP
jgi:hypothetical protein